MVDYAERLAGAMKYSGATKTTLARAIGISYQAVKKVLDGGSHSLSAENNSKAARFLGVSSHWLATGDGEMLDGLTTRGAVQPAVASHNTGAVGQMSENPPLILEQSSSNTFKHAPVVAWACLGDDLRKPNENWPAEAMRVIYSTKPMSGLVKWVEVVDDLLAPRVLRGDIVVVDPDGKPMVDSPVLVRLSDGTRVLRFYRPLAGDAFEVFDGAGRTMDSVRHGIVVEATFVTLSRDSV